MVRIYLDNMGDSATKRFTKGVDGVLDGKKRQRWYEAYSYALRLY